jgi:hypothetical protein
MSGKMSENNRDDTINLNSDLHDESDDKSHTKSNLESNLSTSHMKSIVEDNHTSNTNSITMSNENYIGEPYKMVFTIGRMNPPTSGHTKLISSLHRPERKMRQKCNKNILLNFI